MPHRRHQRLFAATALALCARVALADPVVPPPVELLKRATLDTTRGAYLTHLDDGRDAELTLDPALQKPLNDLLRLYDVPASAVVVMDPRDGRVLAVSEHSSEREPRGLAFEAEYPAASVFKIVTGAALLESGVDPDADVCFHGGLRRIDSRNLADDARRDTRCNDLSEAMGFSLNVVFGKLAARHLDADTLRLAAGRFFFNQPLPTFPQMPVASALVSPATIPDDALGFGRTAAGFGDVKLSPVHGAVLAAAVANGGLVMPPRFIRDFLKDGGRTPPAETPATRVMSPATASVLTRMMVRTVSEGTARPFFRWRRRPVLGDIEVAGKTGSLFGRAPFRDFTWFVGFAPADAPTVAVAAVVANPMRWKVRAPYLAREALRMHFELEKQRGRRASR